MKATKTPEEGLTHLITKAIDKDTLRKTLSSLYFNYSIMLLRNVLNDDDPNTIPNAAEDELYCLWQVIEVLDGTYDVS